MNLSKELNLLRDMLKPYKPKIKHKNVCQLILYKLPNGESVKKDKFKYQTLEEAIAAAKIINSRDKQIHKVVAYKCNTCFKYHIGKNSTLNKK